MDNYSNNMAESMFIINHQVNAIKLKKAIDESYCIENGNIDGLHVLNEGVFETIKNMVIKLVNAIVKVWNKFVHKMEELFGMEKAFLDDNKDVILKKKPIKTEIEMYDYDNTAMVDMRIPVYDENALLNITDEKELTKNMIGSKFASKVGEGENPKEMTKNVLRGSKEKSYLSTDLNFADMYNYCYSFKTLKENLKKEIDTFEKTKENILKVATVRSKGLKEDATEVYSTLFNGYINEVNINKSSSAATTSSNNKSTNTENKNDGTVGSNARSIQGNYPKDKDIEYTVNKSAVGSNNAEELDKNLEKLQENIQIYYRVGSEILAAKLEVASAEFKDYMKILRWHVDNFTSKEKKDKDRGGEQKGTDYTRNNPEEIKPE